MNLPYIGSTRNASSNHNGVLSSLQTPVAAAQAVGGGGGGNMMFQDQNNIVDSQSMVNGRRKHYVYKYPKNMDSKLMSDILGGPLIEEIKKDGMVRRPRSSSKKAIETYKQPQSYLNISVDNGQLLLDADRMRQASSTLNLSTRPHSTITDRTNFENEISDLRDRLWKQEKSMHDMIRGLEDKLQHRQSVQDGDMASVLNSRQIQLQSYETKLRDIERANEEMRRSIQQSELSQKELLAYMKSMQQQESSQMQNMKTLLEEESSNLQKEREKTKALFQEVVRIGENQERQQSSMNGVTSSLEDKVRLLEQKISNGERVASQLAIRGDKSISQAGEVTSQKFQDLQNEIYAIQRDFASQKSAQRNSEDANARYEQEARSAIKQIQSELSSLQDSLSAQFQQKREEDQQERHHLSNELNNIIDSKCRQLAERASFDKQESRDKLMSIESQLKQEAAKQHDTSVVLRNTIEQQINMLITSMQTLSSERVIAEDTIRADILHLRENNHRELEQFKSYQTGVTEKITEMMKQEMQTRHDSDVDLKNLTSGIASDIVKDVNRLKDSIEKQFVDVQGELAKQGAENSSRCAKLSTFAEQECANISGEFSRKFDKMKEMFTKLAEQFKAHLIHYEQTKSSNQSTIDAIDSKLSEQAQQILNQIEESQQVNNDKIVGELKLLENELNATKLDLQDKCIKIEEENLKDIEAVKDAINDLTIAFNENGGRAAKQADEIIAHVDERLQEVINQSNDIKQQTAQIEERIAEVEDSLGNNAVQEEQKQMIEKLSSDLKMVADNQADLTKQLQTDIDHLATTISTVDQNRHQQIQEIIESDQQLKEQVTKEMEQLRESIMSNLKMINETTQTIEDVHQKFDEKFASIEAELAAGKGISKADFDGLIENVDNLLELMRQKYSNNQQTTEPVADNRRSSNSHANNYNQNSKAIVNQQENDVVESRSRNTVAMQQQQQQQQQNHTNQNPPRYVSPSPTVGRKPQVAFSEAKIINNNINHNNYQSSNGIYHSNKTSANSSSIGQQIDRRQADQQKYDAQERHERQLQQSLEKIKRNSQMNRNENVSPQQMSPISNDSRRGITFKTRLNEIDYSQSLHDRTYSRHSQQFR